MYGQSVVLRRRIGVALTFAAVVLGLVAITSLRSTASADPYPPAPGCAVSSSDTTVHPGDTLALTGSGFPADKTVQLTLHSKPFSLGSVRTDARGSFTDTVRIPSSVTGTDHIIVAASGSLSCTFDPSASGGVHVVNAPTGPTTSSNGGTAYTGFAAVTATVVALFLLGGGLLLTLAGRRRSRG